jgi:hypothetical protein
MLMDVQEINLPSDLGAVLDQFKAFALSHGWTLDGDSSGVFQIRSPGFGNQVMIYRIYGQYTGTYDYYGLLTIAGVSPLTPAFSTSMYTGVYSSTGTYHQLSIRSSGAYKAWIIGNDKILMLVQMNNEYSCTSMAIGSFDLFDTTRNDGYFVAVSKGQGALYLWDSLTSSQYNGFVIPGGNFLGVGAIHTWLYGAGCNDASVKSNFYMYNITAIGGSFDSIADLAVNGMAMPYSGIRFMARPTAYGLDNSAGLWRPVGRWPWYVMKFTGLTPGQVLDFGGESYKVFPSMYMPHPWGWAVRVA